MNMGLLIRYKPLGYDRIQFDTEIELKISKQRNKPSSASIKVPTSEACINSPAYGDIEIKYNNKIIFDGTVQLKDYGKEKISLTGYDRLWDFTRSKRLFTQTTTGKTPSELFTDIFDQDATSSYITGSYGETYSSAWIDGFDAKRFVCPNDASFDELMDCKNKCGTDFMKTLADVSQYGDIYRFFYWCENINGQKYLFFQPDGNGKIWESDNYISCNLKENAAEVWNDIDVWGIGKTGTIPQNQDYWTESNLDGWEDVVYSANSAIAFDGTTVNYGQQSLHMFFDYLITDPPIYVAFRRLKDYNSNYLNLETMSSFNFNYRVDNQMTSNDAVITLTDEDGNGVKYRLHGAAGSWHEISITGKTVADGWSVVDAGFDWGNVKYLFIYLTRVGDVNFYLDHCYIQRDPIKSERDGTTSGYDATSIDDYGLRTTAQINMKWVKTIADVNAAAANILQYYKDPQYQGTVTYSDFIPFKLNDNLRLKEYNKDLILPIDKIDWEFKENGEVATKLNVGLIQLSLEDRLKRISNNVDIINFDDGLAYFVS